MSALDHPAPAGGPVDQLAEDAAELQHPVLRRLQTGRSVGAGTRQAALWAMSSRVAAQVIQFLGTVATARLLVPDDYGKVAVVLPIIAFAAIFSSLGLAAAVIHARRVTERLLSTTFWLNAVTGVLLAGLVDALSFPLSHLFREPLLVPLMCLSSLNFALNLSVVHLALLERTMRFKQIALLETACSVLSIGAVVVGALRGGGAFALVLGPLTYTICRTLFTWAVVPWRPRRRPDRASLRELWGYSRGITGFNMFFFWSQNADNLLLGRFAPQADLGNYSRAYALMKLPVSQMQTMMGRVLFPAMTRLRDDRPRLGAAWLRALSVAATITAPVTFGMALAAPAMVEVLFGRRWLGMVPVLQLLAVAALPQTLTSTVGGLLRATGATDQLFRLGVTISTFSLVVIVAGLPWGTMGVATGLTVKYYVEVVIYLRPCLRETQLRPRDIMRALRGVWAALLAMSVAGLAVRALTSALPAWQVLLAQIAVCALVYVGVLLAVDRGPLLVLLGVLRRQTRP